MVFKQDKFSMLAILLIERISFKNVEKRDANRFSM